MEINIINIPHKEQKYDTCGDYELNNGTLDVSVSDTGNDDYNYLIALHEMIEAKLCLNRKISFKRITNFDIGFKGKGEPGDDPKAPYRKEHKFATKIEKMVAKELKVNWDKYEKAINSL